MKMIRILTFMFIGTLAFIPAACSERQIAEAELVSVRWVPKSSIDQFIGSDSKLPKIRAHSGGFYIAEIATLVDLTEIQRKNDYSMRVDSRFCKNPEQLQLLTPLGLYSHGTSVSEISFGTNTPALQKTSNYEIVIFDSLQDDWKIPKIAMQKFDASYPKFNLNMQPEDICIKVRLGGVQGAFNDVESSQIVVSKQALVRARTTQVADPYPP